MTILGIIPARSGSKRIPGKNKKLFHGKPLCHYMMEAATQAKLLDLIVVNTDDEDIFEYVANFPDLIPLKRPAHLATDEAPAIDYIHHTLQAINQQVDIVVILQLTAPLTQPEDIDNTIQLLMDSKADSAVSVVKLEHAIHPIKMKTMEANRLLPFLEEEKGRMAAQDLPTIYVRNCAIYASTIETIEEDIVIGKDCRGYVMSAEHSVDINEMIDFDFAEFLYDKYIKT